jgi:ATP-dependent Lhr-like helicase
VLAALTEQGALFFDELLGDTRCCAASWKARWASWWRWAGSTPTASPACAPCCCRRPSAAGMTGARTPLFGMADAGRWALLRRPTQWPRRAPGRLAPDVLEHVALTLLRRYGVVCWRVLAREADWLPPWRELLRIYHRLEARGEIRGGRFVAGLTGEQFALPEAVGLLREVRKRDKDGEWLVLSAVDPLNLSGSLLPGNKVPALAGNRVLYRDGVAIGALIAGKAELWVELAAEDAARRGNC